MSPAIIVSILSHLIPLVVGYRQKLTLLWFYPLAALIFDLLIVLLRRVAEVNYGIAANFYMVIEFVIVSTIYVYHAKAFKNKKIYWGVFILVITIFTINTISKSIFDFNRTGGSLFDFVYIIYGIFGFYHLLEAQTEVFLEKSWFFWFNVALTVYSSGSFLMFLSGEYLIDINREKFFANLWNTMFQVLNITKNLLIAVALYHYPAKKRIQQT